MQQKWKWLLGVSGLLVVAGALWWVFSPTQLLPPVSTVAVGPDFPLVEVRADARQQSLSLTGTVHDPTGSTVASAEVFLAASSQQSLADARCAVCKELLLSCRAQETARSVANLLDAHAGEMVAALSTRTDESGRFRFEGLAGSSFTVWGRAKGLGEGVKQRAAPGDPVALFLPHPRGLKGRLRDEQGGAVQGHIRLMSRRLSHVFEVDSDARGKFEFDGLGEGPFYLSGTAPGLLPIALSEVEAGAEAVVLTLPAPRRLEVRVLASGEPTEAIVSLEGDHLSRQLLAKAGALLVEQLYPAEVLISAAHEELSSPAQRLTLARPVTSVTLHLERGGRLAVTVMDETDQPVPNPSVELMTHDDAVMSRQGLSTGAVAHFGPLAPGEYFLRATADGFEATRTPVEIRRGEVSVAVTMPKASLISGRVIDEYGRPAPGVSVLIAPTGDSVLSQANGGRFTASVPSPGLYTLHAHHSDWGGGSVNVTAPASDVELQLEPKAGVEVTVTANGRRVEGAQATLLYAEGTFRSDRSSGADGVVLLRGIPPGSYTLIATHPEFLPSERVPVVMEDGKLLRISAQLRAGANIVGQVVDVLGAPVAGAWVTVSPRGAEPDRSDADGKFDIGPLRPKQMYVVRVMQRGLDQLERVTASAGGPDVRIVVSRQPVFRGRVLADGQPLRNFRVDETEVNSPDGRFELPLPATEDRVIVSIEAPGFEPLMVDRPNSPDLGDFAMTRAPFITGIVRDDQGVAVVDAVVTCDSCEQSVLSGADGRFALGKPPFQREFNVVAKKGRRTAIRSVAEGATQSLELILEAGVLLTGSAWLPNGRPAAGVEISGYNIDRSEPISVVTQSDGRFSMEVAPGTYRLMLVLPGYQELAHDPPAIIAEIKGATARIDFGPSPTMARLSVRVVPQPGHALWLVRGELRRLVDPPMELLKSRYAQLVYEPRVEEVIFGGLLPGRYTVVWASFHAESKAGPIAFTVDIPQQAQVNLVR